MSQEQKTAWFYIICLVYLIVSLVLLPRFWGERGITIAILTAGLMWTAGFICITISGHLHSKNKIIEDERDRLITYKATFAGSITGYMGMLIGIIVIHATYAMNGIFIVPVDTLYIMFALVLLTFATFRELAVLVLYRLGDTF